MKKTEDKAARQDLSALPIKPVALHAQTTPAPSREQIRQNVPVRAPRQSKRPTERSK